MLSREITLNLQYFSNSLESLNNLYIHIHSRINPPPPVRGHSANIYVQWLHLVNLFVIDDYSVVPKFEKGDLTMINIVIIFISHEKFNMTIAGATNRF